MLGLNGDVETVDMGGVGGSRFELRETVERMGGNGGVEGRVWGLRQVDPENRL